MARVDEPIKYGSEDRFQRRRLADVIADEIQSTDSTSGFVVGILGPWGAGKTSLLNLVQVRLEANPHFIVLHFNPWLFSGTVDLVERFFEEISAQLDARVEKLATLADAFAKYSKMLGPLKILPVAGQIFEGLSQAGELVGAMQEERRGSVNSQRLRIEEALENLNYSIVVMIDDIDRLDNDEIRDIFKLVRLSGNFPNLIYVVAFDRKRVEDALKAEGFSGRDYLEKIIQAQYDLPAMSSTLLIDEYVKATNDEISEIANSGPFDSDRWTYVLTGVIQPLLRNMRDIRRVSASLRATVIHLEGKVSLVDQLALEAIRVFMPDFFVGICQNQDALAGTSRDWDASRINSRRRAKVEALVQRSEHPEITAVALQELFPLTTNLLEGGDVSDDLKSAWPRDRRVADSNVLAYYCERVAGARLEGQWAAEHLVQVFSDNEAVKEFWSSREAASWEDVIRALPIYKDSLLANANVATLLLLLNLTPLIPTRRHAFLEPRPAQTLMWLAIQWLRTLKSHSERMFATEQILMGLDSLSLKLAFLRWVEPRTDTESEILTVDAALHLHELLRHELRSADSQTLARESDLFELVNWERTTRQVGEAQLSLDLGSQELSCALVNNSVVTEVEAGSNQVRYLPREAFLVEIFGSIEDAKRRATDCRDKFSTPMIDAVLQLQT